jgi:DNA-directed RNA polymerase subunit RPC12/RpoP
MPAVDFTCPKCGEESEADVPAGGARIECPACGKRIRVIPPDEPNSQSKSPPQPAFEVVEDEPATPPEKARKPVTRVAEEEDDEDTDPNEPLKKSKKPTPGKRGKKDRDKTSGVPVWVWVAGRESARHRRRGPDARD